MSDQPEALRLAGQFERSAESLLKLDQMIGQETRKASQYARAAAELRHQHSRIEADEALMRTAAEALEHAQNWFSEDQSSYADCHAAITALRKRLESSNGL